MKRHSQGINLDEGIPLSTGKEFELLYMELFPQETEILTHWLDQGTKPLMLGGQIGTGKTTLINKVLSSSDNLPDITLHFDRNSVNPKQGEFYAIALAGFIQTALKAEADLSAISLPEELNHNECSNWEDLKSILAPEKRTLTAHRLRKSIISEFENDTDYIDRVLTDIGASISKTTDKPLSILASGIDKFATNSSAFVSLQGVLDTLCSFRTLFEVNAVHIFIKETGSRFSKVDRLYLTACSSEHILELYSKRMGAYLPSIPKKDLEVLAELSAGIPRQALRLLVHYLEARKKRKKGNEHLIRAALATEMDFFLYSLKPSDELINVIRKQSFLLANTVRLPGDKETAQRALYGNWIVLTEQPDHAKWPVLVNPLIKGSFSKSVPTETPEQTYLNNYAETFGISANGLSFPEGWLGQEQTQHPIQLYLTEILDALASALLSKDRADRVIISYKNKELVKPARSYLFAKANTFDFQSCEHFQLDGGKDQLPIEELDELLTNPANIFSIDFGAQWTYEQLTTLDSQRDLLLQHQMIWWVPEQVLQSYLSHWTQLRQLFEVYSLDDELLGSLSIDEIQEDIEYFTDLKEGENSAPASMVQNLKSVLNFLKVKHGS
ncbi:MAG: hypothetical protein ACR2PX_02805 [Endozoicomonas sp.]|uniref:hypothetical protein n=1 Tax=Endozoicomonas sp. TaxID=1892382 RepID=UPI003D9BB7EE